MDLKYRQWQEPLASAILEFNREQLREKVQKAEEAITQRIEQLTFDPGNEHERRALFDGLDLLRSAKTGWASPKGRVKRPGRRKEFAAAGDSESAMRVTAHIANT